MCLTTPKGQMAEVIFAFTTNQAEPSGCSGVTGVQLTGASTTGCWTTKQSRGVCDVSDSYFNVHVWSWVLVRVFLSQHCTRVITSPEPANYARPLVSEQNNKPWLLLQCSSLSIWLCWDTPCTQSKPYHSVRPAHCQFPDPSSSAGWSQLRVHPNLRPGLQTKREENVKCWFTEGKHRNTNKHKHVPVPKK